jgi:hypothetical protein
MRKRSGRNPNQCFAKRAALYGLGQAARHDQVQTEGLFKNLPRDWQCDRDFLEAAVQRNHYVMKFVPHVLKNDVQFAMQVVKWQPNAIRYTTPRVKGNLTVAQTAFNRDVRILPYVSPRVQEVIRDCLDAEDTLRMLQEDVARVSGNKRWTAPNTGSTLEGSFERQEAAVGELWRRMRNGESWETTNYVRFVLGIRTYWADDDRRPELWSYNPVHDYFEIHFDLRENDNYWVKLTMEGSDVVRAKKEFVA